MINVKELRCGCHVLVGSNYPTFSVPKHQAQVVQIGDGFIYCRSHAEQGDPDEYNESEIEGINIADIIPILEKNGFSKSQLCDTRYFRIDPLTKDRITINLNNFHSCSCYGKESVDRTGVVFLHQLEACIADAGISFEFNFNS